MEFAGLDVHKASVQACLVDESGRVLREERFTTSDVGLGRLLNAVRTASCVMESSTACFPVYDFLQEQKVKVRVAHPKRLKAICSAKIKTDVVDARMLAQLERVNLIPEAYIPSKDVRDKRDLIRHHIALVHERTRVINQTKAALLRHRVKLPENVFTKKAEKLANASAMPESLRLRLNHARQEHELLQKELKEVNARIEELALQNKDAVLLHSIKGIGWFLAFGISMQVDGAARFPTAEKLVSYAGLCPNVRQSGETLHMTSINHDSCGLLKWMLIQGAWSVVRFNPRFQRMYKKLCKKKSQQKAIIIVAKRLLHCIYFMLRDQTTFNLRGEKQRE